MIGWTSAEAHAPPTPELGAVVQPFVDDWRAPGAEAVERWREEVGKSARLLRLGGTLEAASDGRVELLLHRAGVQKEAYRCPRAAVPAATATCPLDGTTMERRDDGLDLAVRLTLAYGGDLLPGGEPPGSRRRRGDRRDPALLGRVDRAQLLAELGRLQRLRLLDGPARARAAPCRTRRALELPCRRQERFSSEPTVSLNAPTAPLRLFPIFVRWPPTIATRS